jgi:hypothetical protein
MFGTFLDKATGLLDRNFLLAYWFPVFIAASLAALIRIWVSGFEASVQWWQQDWIAKSQVGGFITQIWILVGILVLITVLAYLLQPFTRLIIRSYEGYWPTGLRSWFTARGEYKAWQEKSTQRTQAEEAEDWSKYSDLQAQLFYGYPQRPSRLMPTRLGNVLRAAEDYSKSAYGMDSVFWWPRLWPLLPEAVKTEIDGALTLVVALLNFSLLMVLVALGGSVYLGIEGNWLRILLVALGGIGLSFVSYRAAVAQAQDYGERIRSAIDLYRFDLLKALHQPLPETLNDESGLWERLMLWLYSNDRVAVADMKYDLKSSSPKENPS